MKYLLTSFDVEDGTYLHFTLISNMKYVHSLSLIRLLSRPCSKGGIGSPEDNRFVCDVQSLIQLKHCVSRDLDLTKGKTKC